MRRHETSDAKWERIKALLPGRKGDPGVTVSEEDNRRFLNAAFWIARAGAPWRDLPARFGEWASAYQRSHRRARKGVWGRLMGVLAEEADPEWRVPTRSGGGRPGVAAATP